MPGVGIERPQLRQKPFRFADREGLKQFAEAGIQLDAHVSYDLLVNIFHPETPLHDGAVIVREGRVIGEGWTQAPGSNHAEIEALLDARRNGHDVRGATVFKGYYRNEAATREAVDAEGWLHTGEVAQAVCDEIRIVDRKKDIMITAGGKNITPSEIENQLKFSPYITDAVVIGDKRPYLVALVMIDHENVERYAQDHAIPFSNYASLTRAPKIQALIGAEMERVNKKFARVEQIKKFFLLDTQLSAEDEELTPTMKLKRKLVEKKYAAQIDAMYR